jgi:hypothetical protein
MRPLLYRPFALNSRKERNSGRGLGMTGLAFTILLVAAFFAIVASVAISVWID